MKKLIIGSILVSTAVVGLSQPSAAGTWSGRVQFNEAEITKGLNAEQKKAVQQQLAEARKLTLSMVIRPNNTFTMTFNPPAGMQGQQKMQIEGKWLQKGTTITLTPTRQNGNAVSARQQQPQTLTMSSDGRTMRWNPGTDIMQGTIVFTRQR